MSAAADEYIPVGELPDDALGSRLELAMREWKWSQRELARRIGVNDRTVGRWLSHVNEPTATQVRRICEEMELSADWLLGLTPIDQSVASEVDTAIRDLGRAQKELNRALRKQRRGVDVFRPPDS